mmetsp:Transcript_5170/g.9952  ORF Transcript_5170/g.9952 Transcript_5170/m.9952 type:complete len:126 (-) Transcript_5170:644-1021(-)
MNATRSERYPVRGRVVALYRSPSLLAPHRNYSILFSLDAVQVLYHNKYAAACHAMQTVSQNNLSMFCAATNPKTAIKSKNPPKAANPLALVSPLTPGSLRSALRTATWNSRTVFGGMTSPAPRSP